jgi:hypothetical protein
MTEQYLGWALVVGVVLGGALVWFVIGRLPRRTDDVSREERRHEAEWIARVVEARGGVAPPALVDEILELHADYLAGPPLELRPDPLSGRSRRPRHAAVHAPAGSELSAAPAPPGPPPAERLRSELADEDRHAV